MFTVIKKKIVGHEGKGRGRGWMKREGGRRERGMARQYSHLALSVPCP